MIGLIILNSNMLDFTASSIGSTLLDINLSIAPDVPSQLSKKLVFISLITSEKLEMQKQGRLCTGI